jgi:hypothetical protein
LAILGADEYILGFLFATQLRFRQTNNAGQQNKQGTFLTLICCGTGLDAQQMPPYRQCFNVGRNFKQNNLNEKGTSAINW